MVLSGVHGDNGDEEYYQRIKTCEANLASPQCRKEYRVLDIRLPFDLRRQQYFFFLIFSHQTFFPRGGEVPVHPHLNSIDNWQSIFGGVVEVKFMILLSYWSMIKLSKHDSGSHLPRESKLVVPPRSVPPLLVGRILVPGALGVHAIRSSCVCSQAPRVEKVTSTTGLPPSSSAPRSILFSSHLCCSAVPYLLSKYG